MYTLIFWISICITLISTVAAPPLEKTSPKDIWLVRLILNIAGYSTLFIPAYFIIKYLKKIKYNETGN